MVPPGPGEAGRRGVKVAPHILNTSRVKKATEGKGALSRHVIRRRANPIQKAIKSSIKITSEDGGDRGVNFGDEIIKELVSGRIPVRGIYRTDSENRITKRKRPSESHHELIRDNEGL